MAGCALASPYILFQVWRLIAPALYTNQKKFAMPFVLMSSGGIVAGWLFSHYIVFPYMIEFFGTFSNANLQFMPKVETAFDLYTKMLLGMAIVFQMPTAVFFLAKMGLVSARLAVEQHQIRHPDHLHPGGGADAVRRPVEPDRVRRADGRPLPVEHRDRLAGRPAKATPAAQ